MSALLYVVPGTTFCAIRNVYLPAPDVPAMKELGLDLPPIGAFRGIIAPKGVPPERLKKLEVVFKKAMESDEFKEFARKNSFDLMPLSSAEFNKFLAEQTEAYGRILKEVKK